MCHRTLSGVDSEAGDSDPEWETPRPTYWKEAQRQEVEVWDRQGPTGPTVDFISKALLPGEIQEPISKNLTGKRKHQHHLRVYTEQ